MRSLALVGMLAGLFTAPALAGTYSATLAAPQTKRIIARDMIWACGPAACQGTTEASRPAVVCQALAKRAGAVTSFVANGRALAPAELERCNKSAAQR